MVTEEERKSDQGIKTITEPVGEPKPASESPFLELLTCDKINNMSKYKIVGIVNFLLGILYVIYPTFNLLFIIPKLTRFYSEFDAKGPSLTSTYFILGFLVLTGFANLFLGFKLFSRSKEIQNKYFKYSATLAIGTFILLGIAYTIANLSVVLPIYNLTPQL